MNRKIIPILFWIMFLPVSTIQVHAENDIHSGHMILNESERAGEIANRMINRDDGQTMYSQVQLITCAYAMKNGKRTCASRPVQKSIESLVIDVGEQLENTVSLGIINDPPFEKNMAFLQKDYDEAGKESDQWMYFPALKKMKRIVSQSENRPKTGSVFGSEISYEDLEKRHLSNYHYSYEGTETIDNKTCDKIIAYPTEKHAPRTSYSKEIYWIDRETSIALKVELYDKQGRHEKSFFCKEIINSKDVWMNKIRIVVNYKTRRMTMEKIVALVINVPIDEELVGLRALKDAACRESQLENIRKLAR